jgi:hemimethylated DNA binding protein
VTDWLELSVAPTAYFYDQVKNEDDEFREFAETEDSTYAAYVSEQNLVSDETHAPCPHPACKACFGLHPAGWRGRRARIQ